MLQDIRAAHTPTTLSLLARKRMHHMLRNDWGNANTAVQKPMRLPMQGRLHSFAS